MAKRGMGKGYSGGGSNNNTGGGKAMPKAMAMRTPSKPPRVSPAPSMAMTKGPGSRCGMDKGCK